jgi:heme/copper-type cytochrome/quinol oxidase subunit 2
MHDSNNANEMLEVTGQVLIRCFVMGLLVLLFWLGALMLAGDLAYSVHAKIAPISREQFYLINYAGGLMTKAAVFVLFLFPYIAIRLVLKKLKS